MDNRLIQENQIIEDALHTYPVAKLPNNLTPAVMMSIRTASRPRFQVTRTDALLAIVLTLVLGAVLFGFQSLPAPVLLQLRIYSILLWQSTLVNARLLLPLLSIMLGTLLAAIAFHQILRVQRV